MKLPPPELLAAANTKGSRALDIIGDWYAENITAPRIVSCSPCGFHRLWGQAQGVALRVFVPGDPRAHVIVLEDHEGLSGEWYQERGECNFVELSFSVLGRDEVIRAELTYSVDQYINTKVLAEWPRPGPRYSRLVFEVDGKRPRRLPLTAADLMELCK